MKSLFDSGLWLGFRSISADFMQYKNFC